MGVSVELDSDIIAVSQAMATQNTFRNFRPSDDPAARAIELDE